MPASWRAHCEWAAARNQSAIAARSEVILLGRFAAENEMGMQSTLLIDYSLEVPPFLTVLREHLHQNAIELLLRYCLAEFPDLAHMLIFDFFHSSFLRCERSTDGPTSVNRTKPLCRNTIILPKHKVESAL